MREWTQIYKADCSRNDVSRTKRFLRWYRVGQYYRMKKIKVLELICRKICSLFLLRNNQFPFETQIGAGLRLPHLMGIVISGGAVIGTDCTIFQQVTLGEDERGKNPVIGNNVMIGAGAKIIGGAVIGDNVKVGANAVVTKTIPSNCTVIGCNQIINSEKVKIDSE